MNDIHTNDPWATPSDAAIHRLLEWLTTVLAKREQIPVLQIETAAWAAGFPRDSTVFLAPAPLLAIVPLAGSFCALEECDFAGAARGHLRSLLETAAETWTDAGMPSRRVPFIASPTCGCEIEADVWAVDVTPDGSVTVVIDAVDGECRPGGCGDTGGRGSRTRDRDGSS